jgi:hypothetical protein
MGIEIAAVEPWHLERILATVRPADLAEINAIGLHNSPLAALQQSVAISQHSAVALHDGVPLCVFGVSPVSLLSGVGSPWLIGSVVLEQHTKELVARAPAYIRLMLRIYPRLENHVHAENRRAVRWLRAAGFTIHPPAPYGLRGELFHPFSMGA